MVRCTEDSSNLCASWGRDLLDKRSDNQILRHQSYILILQFIRQVPQLYLLSGNTLFIFLAISQASSSKDVGTQSSHTITVSPGLLCPVVRPDDCLISTTTSHLMLLLANYQRSLFLAGTAKLPFICKGVTFENKGRTRTTQRMKKKWQRKE